MLEQMTIEWRRIQNRREWFEDMDREFGDYEEVDDLHLSYGVSGSAEDIRQEMLIEKWSMERGECKVGREY